MKRILTSALIISVMGCAVDSPRGGDLLSSAGAEHEYQVAKADMVLPPGSAWPASAPEVSEAPADMKFQRGVGEQNAQFIWLCAWVSAALDGEAPWDEAKGQVMTLRERSLWRFMDRTGRALHEELFAAFDTRSELAIAEYRADHCAYWDAAGGEVGGEQ